MEINKIKQNAEEKAAKLKAIDWPKIGKRIAVAGGVALGIAGVAYLVKQGGIDTVKEAVQPVAESVGEAAEVAVDVAEAIA